MYFSSTKKNSNIQLTNTEQPSERRLLFLYLVMDKPISELTYKVVAFSFVANFAWEDCIDWAYEMLLLGHDTPNLTILASISKPSEQSEIQLYLEGALNELGIGQVKEQAAIISYCYYYIRKVAGGEGIEMILGILSDFYDDNCLEVLVQDFWLLHWAWEDLNYGLDHQYYWPGATRDNLEHIAIETARNWLKEHENQLDMCALK